MHQISQRAGRDLIISLLRGQLVQLQTADCVLAIGQALDRVYFLQLGDQSDLTGFEHKLQ